MSISRSFLGVAIAAAVLVPAGAAEARSTKTCRSADMRYPFMPGWRFDGRDDVTWLPCLHARAIPGGPVTADAYQAMKAELLDRVMAEDDAHDPYLADLQKKYGGGST